MDFQGGLRGLPQRHEARRPSSAPRQGRGRLRLASLRQARGPASSPEIAALVAPPVAADARRPRRGHASGMSESGHPEPTTERIGEADALAYKEALIHF